MYGPVIQGKLVRLRPPKTEDAAVMMTWFDDLEVTRFIMRRHPPSIEEENAFVENLAKDPNVIQWVVELEGRPVGTTAIVQIDWKNGFGMTGTIIGEKAAWGKGVARELMQLRATYAFTQLPLRKLKSGYVDGNVASARAQAAAGYREVGRWHRDQFVDGEWRDLVLTELMREDWEKAEYV
ncbi:MAG TPA: GNAT family protein [Candidatus Dormibacteraeota bacterium]|nr:GNAT family protein [Candidatus Dormibacteraeota bacterium]